MKARPNPSQVVVFAAFALGLSLLGLNAALPLGLLGSVSYLTLLLLALWSPQRRCLLVLTGLVLTLILIDAALCPDCPDFATAAATRLPVFAVALISGLALYARPRHRAGENDIDDAGPLVPQTAAGGDIIGRKDAAAFATAEREQMAALAHEVRSPLNAMVGFAEIMEVQMYGPLGDPRYGEYAHNIQTSGQHILTVIDDYLGLARIASGHEILRLSRIAVRRLINDVTMMVKPLALKADVRVEIDTPGDLPDLRADPGKLTQILLNLLVNAIKFTDGKGRVTVSAMTDYDGNMILIVSDNGVGMTIAETQFVMEPFARSESAERPREGTGLGLTLVKSLADLHDGAFWLESAPGIGTKAYVRLPKARVLKRVVGEKPFAGTGLGAAQDQAELFNNLSI